MGHLVSVASTQLCPCRVKAAQTKHKWMWPCSNNFLFTKAGCRLDLACGPLAADPGSRGNRTLQPGGSQLWGICSLT